MSVQEYMAFRRGERKGRQHYPQQPVTFQTALETRRPLFRSKGWRF